MTFETETSTCRKMSMIADIHILSTVPNNGHSVETPTKRIVKNFDHQIRYMVKQQIFLHAGMKRKCFLDQARTLRDKLESIEVIQTGNVRIITCLPFSSLINRMRGLRCGRNTGTCVCSLDELETTYPPNNLYSLVEVNDGRDRRFERGGNRQLLHIKEMVQSVVSPDEPFTAWAGVDLAILYPNILQQQGFIFGQTSIAGAPTALWLDNGLPTFGSIRGKSFNRHAGGRWAIPSYQKLVTI